MDRHERRLVDFLSRPSTYPHPVSAVARRETHVSHVFLAGAFAYKLKKPVTFPFLDASSLPRRKRFCLLELSLNRRLAPDVYLGLVPLTEQGGRLQLGGQGRPVEWVVKMRRLPEHRMLDRLVAQRRVRAQDMARLAGRLVPFFRRAARGRRIAWYGQPAQVEALVFGNLRECEPFLGDLFTAGDRDALAAAYRQFLTLQQPVLAARVRQGRVVDGHGDLRCENICLIEPPSVFDCVEFQPAFRCGDMANDLAFLLMDLEFRRRPDLADALEQAYRRRMRDATFSRVAAFYKCHRTLVRGKVRGLAWRQHPRSPEGRRIRRLAQRHFRLARRYACQFAPPRLIMVGGLTGTGKSTLARGLAESLGAVWLRTDEIRLREFARYRRAGQSFRGGLYAAHVSDLVYQRLIQRAEALLREGRSVVCDGTFSRAVGRRVLRMMARRLGVSFHLFECVVPRAVAVRRIARRLARRRDLSEARPEYYDRMRAGYEPVRGFSAREWTRLSDHRPPRRTLAAALQALRRAWL